MTKGGSGLYLNANDKEAFLHFLQNSTAKYFTSGTFGMTYILTLNPGVESKYLSLDASSYSRPVRQILLKTTFIYPLKIQLFVKPPRDKAYSKKHTATIDNFYEEVNIHTDVYLKTMKYLEPLCPAIVYATVVSDNTDPLMQIVSNIIMPNVPEEQFVTYPGLSVGLIGMEIVGNRPDNVAILKDYMEDIKNYKSYMPKAFHTLIEFIIQTGYNHGDFHGANLLVDSTANNYFWGKTGKVTIIDFGFTEKLTQEKYNRIKSLYDQQKYTDILSLLCDIPRKDGYNMNDYVEYKYMCIRSQPQFNSKHSINKPEINNAIIELYALREESINHLANTFTDKYLPLSNSEKNKMYNGPDLRKTYITSFEKIYTGAKDMFLNIEIILKQLPVINKEKKFRLISKSCYMIMYLLNNGFEKTIENYVATMIYAGVFENATDLEEVLDIVSDAVDEDKLKDAIKDCRVLQSVYFNDFLDYFTDEQLKKISEKQLEEEFTKDDWLFRPELAAMNLKNKAKIPSGPFIARRSRTEKFPTLQNPNLFQELPFQEDVENAHNPRGKRKSTVIEFIESEPVSKTKKMRAGRKSKKQQKKRGTRRNKHKYMRKKLI